MSTQRVLVMVCAVGLAASAALAGSTAMAVSPGSAVGTRIGDPCPTFSWARVEGAASYDLVVYRVAEEGEESAATEPVLKESFAGAVSGWTPPLERCLEPGGRYAWAVQARGAEGVTDWSPPLLFAVVVGPSERELEEALATVRWYLEDGGPQAAGGRAAGADPATGSPGSAAAGDVLAAPDPAPTALSGAAGDPALTVNGAAVVTTATLAPGLCEALGYRYIDLGDGTVLDCNTDLVWLKNANCAGTKGWQEAKDWADNLASGSCGLTDGSVAGNWRLPEIGEFCSTPAPVFAICPAEEASDSLVDYSVSGSPKVVNAAGDAGWSEGDAFVGVRSDNYWSADKFGSDGAWGADLNTGWVFRTESSYDCYVWPVRGGP